MNFCLSIFNNREKAIIFWMFVFLVWAMFQKNIRNSIFSFLGSLFRKKILALLVAMLVYVGLEIFMLYKLQYWSFFLVKDTVYWILGGAFILLMNVNKINQDKHYFNQILLDNLKLVFILEFIINLYSFNLWVELILIPLLFLLVAMDTIAGFKKEYLPIKNISNFILSSFVIFLIIFVFSKLLSDYRSFAIMDNLRLFLLPFLLTLVYVPFIYLTALFIAYENLLVRQGISTESRTFINFVKQKIWGLLPEKSNLFDEVKREKKISKNIEKILNKKSKSLWFSPWEIAIVIAAFLLFLILTHIQTIFPGEAFISFINNLYPFQGSPFALTKDNHYQNLISIHAGIGAVLIGLAFFIAQQIAKERDSGNSYKGFAFLKRSKFFPILVAEILFFFLFLWGSVNIFSIIPILLIGFFTLLSLYRTIDLMVNDFDLKKEEENVFAEKIRSYFLKVLDSDITKLVGDNRFRKRLEEFSNFVEFTPFSPIDKDDYFEIKTTEEGILKNIKYKNLKKFLSFLQKLAPLEKNELDINSSIENTKNKNYVRRPYCYITPRFFSELKEVGGTLCWIRKDLITDEKIEKEINKKARKFFVIGSPRFDLEEARNYIQKLKMLCLDLVRSQKTDELRQALGIYTKLIENFYEYLKPFGGGFSEEQANNMRLEIAFGGFKPIEWLAEDMREIFEQGIISANREIVGEVAYLPIRLLKYSIDYKDHLIFQQFQYYPTRLYQHAHKLKRSGNDELADFVLDRSWRYLKEITDYYLEPKLKDKEYPEEEFKKFSISIFRIFQTLLKASLDKLDIENFETYLSTVLSLFRNLSTTTRFGDEKAEELNNYLQKKREEMLFGLASWIFFKFEHRRNEKKLEQIFKNIKNRLPADISKFTEIFLNSHSFDAEQFWGWDNWEMEEKGEGSVHTIQILEKLERFYAIQSLILLESKTDEEIENLNLPPSRDLAFLAEGTRDLLKTLDDIVINPKNWEFVLSEKSISKIDCLKKLLAKAKKAQDENDLQRKRDAVISDKKIEKFRKGVVKNFYANHSFRNILKHYDQFFDKSNEAYPKNINKLGINTVFDKAPFFDDSIWWHVSYAGFEEGSDFSRSMANGENREIIMKLKEKLEKIEVNEFESKLQAFNDLSNVIILAINNASWRFFEVAKRAGSYTPKWRLSNIAWSSQQEIAGLYKKNNIDIPVYEIYDGTNETSVLILRKNIIGSLIQYSPLDDGQDKRLQEDYFLIDVQTFDTKKNTELIRIFLFRNTPQWLKDIGSKKEQKDYLKERVLIHIFERFEFELNKLLEGFYIEI